MYFRIVRGDTRRPSFSSSSFAIRSSPHEGVLSRNLSNHILKRGWDRSPASFGLPAPEKAEALALPSDQGLGPHHGQSIAPIEPAAEQYQSQARRIVGTSGLDRALLIEGQLLAQEQILGRERSSGTQAETQKVD
jgi:hypothetical protein